MGCMVLRCESAGGYVERRGGSSGFRVMRMCAVGGEVIRHLVVLSTMDRNDTEDSYLSNQMPLSL